MQSCLDYLTGALGPEVVATSRQVNLVAACNARCVHCIGLYVGDIIRGQETHRGRLKRMPEEQAMQALDDADDITSFFMNGSEFLLHPAWRSMVSKLAGAGVRLSMSTNGMLLNRKATDFLINSGILMNINFSFDGAKPTTVERIREKVSFQTLTDHLRYFLQRLSEARIKVPVCISMVLMKSNVDECSALVRLADSFKILSGVDVHVSFDLLNSAPNEAYNRFFESEWIEITDETAKANLREAASIAHALGLRTFYCGQELSNAVARADTLSGIEAGRVVFNI